MGFRRLLFEHSGSIHVLRLTYTHLAPLYSVTGIQVYSLVNLSSDVVKDDEKGYGKNNSISVHCDTAKK